jgi:Tfp pilus assembly protein PilX
MPRSHRPRAAGSAFVITLLVLVILTVLGLALTVVTQTEMQLGANERTVSRVFYAADSGIALATARALVTADYRATTYQIAELGTLTPGSFNIRTSPFAPILDAPCNLCEINNAGAYNQKAYRKINHALTAQADRLRGTSTVIDATHRIGSMIEVQPWQSTLEAARQLYDQADPQKGAIELAQISY